jgi:hypothetical protein
MNNFHSGSFLSLHCHRFATMGKKNIVSEERRKGTSKIVFAVRPAKEERSFNVKSNCMRM